MGRPRSDALVPVASVADRIYLALRAGPLDSEQLADRVGGTGAVRALIDRGHVACVKLGRGGSVTYRLTPEGRAACPSRRATELEVRPASRTACTGVQHEL